MSALAKSETTELANVTDLSGGLLEVISRAARDPSVDIDKMERLLMMQERVQERSAKAAYIGALADMQPELPVITERGKIIIKEKGTQNVIQETSFARWEDINEAIRPLLHRFGFSLSFRTGLADDGKVCVTGVLSHVGGHQEETTMILPHDSSGSKNSVQAIGSSTSYGKRYTTIALLNITSKGEDDDALQAAIRETIVEQPKAKDKPFPQGPAKNRTELKNMGRAFWRDVEGAGDPDELDACVASHAPLIAQLKADLPEWWEGGNNRDGTTFEGLGEVINRCRTGLVANAAYNPLSGG